MRARQKETRNPVVKAARDEDSFIDNAPGGLADQPAGSAKPDTAGGEGGQAHLTGQGNSQVRQ